MLSINFDREKEKGGGHCQVYKIGRQGRGVMKEIYQERFISRDHNRQTNLENLKKRFATTNENIINCKLL